jgi:Mrp family chromosome partitioning ATPase
MCNHPDLILLIDANLREPSLHKTLELANDWGLSLLLLDESNTSNQDYIQPVHPSIDVLTAGSPAEDAVKLLSSGRMKELLESFEQTYDLVLIDAPAILKTVDARILATLCDRIIIVSRLGKVTQADVIQATDILKNLNLVGVIANTGQ